MAGIRTFLVLVTSTIALAGCNLWRTGTEHSGPIRELEWAQSLAIEYPDALTEAADEQELPSRPRSVAGETPDTFHDITLSAAIEFALQNSEVLRDLGGRILVSPDSAVTRLDPAIRESDPLFGVEGALSQFDAQFTSSLFSSYNDRGLNNVLTSGGARELAQDTLEFQTEISKLAATGTRFSLRNVTGHDRSNQSGNLFPAAWDVQYEATARQPLLQGAGVTFNRIAGPSARPGFNFSNGVLIARINTDVSLADFEASLLSFLSDIEEAYWDLYFAYRDLDAKIAARDSALETWRRVKAAAEASLEGGEAYQEAQARAQYLQFQQAVHDALNGTREAGSANGVYLTERRLRRMLGMVATDDVLLRPSEEPTRAEVRVDWFSSLNQALAQRNELRRSAWNIEKSQLELLAAKNFTLPRLDAIGTYRWRGFGQELSGPGSTRFASAYDDLASGDHQEWQLGMELSMPFGQRQAWAGVRNAELKLSRARAIHRELEHQVAHDLSDAVAEVERAHLALVVQGDQLRAARERRDATTAAYQTDKVRLDLLLDAQRSLADVESTYYRSLAGYAKALKDFHVSQGTLLTYNQVFLEEGPSPIKAYSDAARFREKWPLVPPDQRIIEPMPISRGALVEEITFVETASAANNPTLEEANGLPSHGEAND